MKKHQKSLTKRIAFMGLMVAVEIIFERLLAFSTDTMRISVTFLPRALSGTIFGFPAFIISVLADLIGGFLAYGLSVNPFITLAAGLKGLGYGICLWKKRSPLRILIAAVWDQFVCGLLITTQGLIWFGYMPQSWASYATRVPQCATLFVLELVLLMALILPYNRLKTLYTNYMSE